eukprot:Skav235367  [mRNA]  locus=scaffold3967:94005:101822:+ [translate_table: standard]
MSYHAFLTSCVLKRGLSCISGGCTMQERKYNVTLSKVEGKSLGLDPRAEDVDFMAERSVLPILFVSGGIAETWNREHPEAKINPGDSIIEVNGARHDVSAMLQKCKVDPVLSLTIIKCLTYGHLVQDLENLISTQGCGAVLIQLSWNDAVVFNGKDGCPNAAMRLAGAGEYKFGANANLQPVALKVLQQITDKYVPRLISHADLWALAANVAIRVMGGPSILTHFGRRDAQGHSEGAQSCEGRLPEGHKDSRSCAMHGFQRAHLRDIFYPKGFTDQDIVALSGARTVSACASCHEHRVAFHQLQKTTERLWKDNAYFKNLLNKTWTMATDKDGKPQYWSGDTMVLSTDIALVKDPKFKTYVERYAADQAVFFQDFQDL